MMKEIPKCLITTVFKGDKCWSLIDAENEFDSFGDFARAFLQEHMKDARLELEVEEAIDIKFQPMIAIKADFGLW